MRDARKKLPNPSGVLIRTSPVRPRLTGGAFLESDRLYLHRARHAEQRLAMLGEIIAARVALEELPPKRRLEGGDTPGDGRMVRAHASSRQRDRG